MTCIRCQGLMLAETLVDMEAGYHEMWSRTWRCVNCGHRADAVMQQHRRAGIEKHRGGLTLAEPVVAYEPNSVEPLAA